MSSCSSNSRLHSFAAVLAKTRSCHVSPGSRAFIMLIAALMAMTALSIDMNLPAVPLIAETLGGSLFSAQLTVTLFFAGFAVGQLVWGPVSDRYGRKPALMAGMVLYLLSTAACTATQSIEQLLAMRVAQGFAAGSGVILARAIVRDCFKGAKMARVMSLVIATFLTAPMIAPSIGAVLLNLGGWRTIFAVLLGYGCVLFVLVLVFLPECLPERDPEALRPARFLGAYRALFRNPRSAPWALIVIFGCVPLNIYVTNTAVVFMDHYRFGTRQFAIVFGVIAACTAAGNLLNAQLVRRIPLQGAILLGLGSALAAGVAAMVVVATNPEDGWMLAPALGALTFSMGLVVSNATALALQPHDGIVGSATSALGVGQTLLPASIGGLVALLYNGTPWPMLLGLEAALGAAILTLAFASQSMRRRTQAGGQLQAARP